MRTKPITKSVRLTPDEAAELDRVCREEPVTEAALLKKWVLDGLRRWKLDRALDAYARREVSLGEGAVMAGVPLNTFMAEVERRNVIIMDADEATFRENLERLGRQFELPDLARAAHPPRGQSRGGSRA